MTVVKNEGCDVNRLTSILSSHVPEAVLARDVLYHARASAHGVVHHAHMAARS
jgi:hypothetical protein